VYHNPLSSKSSTSKIRIAAPCDLALLRTRWYNPNIGQFTSFDDFEGGPEDPLHQHKYVYAGNNPVMNNDPDGRDFTSEVISALGMQGILGAVTQPTTAPATTQATTQPLASDISEAGKQFIKKYESLRLSPYDDQTGNPINAWVKGATIGWGHLILKSEWQYFSQGISQELAEDIFTGDLHPFVKSVRNSIIKPSLMQHEFDALVTLAFNIGVGGFEKSTVVKLINNPDSTPAQIEAAWKLWNKSQGNVMQGLINRRNAEWKLYSKGEY